MNRKKILITGSSGFLGGRIAKYLAESDKNEIRLGTTKDIFLPTYIRSGKVVSMVWDSQSSLDSACQNTEIIIHCAGMNASDCTKDPRRALEFNGHITGRLLDAAIKNGVSRFLFLSTAHVYSNSFEGIISESSLVTNIHPYATSNFAGETEVNKRTLDGKISGINIRLSNAYGAPVDPKVDCWMLLVNDLCRQAVTTKRMVLKSTGIQKRDFIPIHEVCRAIEHLITFSLEKTENTFNVGGGLSISVWEMAKLIQERCRLVLGFSPELERVQPKDEEYSSDFRYDVTKLLSSGFEYSNFGTSEIDQLLNFCKLNFKN
ncbi:UDP-glucose 4-epimerase [Leptospira tipperaryensis]|uniref:UDP-glucose 4-epimerase n=1 Tax=Leptospira tipperaryensis TaxID=2564040 RepID=A0A1D7V2C9_9LEPT|nr:SDR family oxidoreductase [Leptospira tipperaryensis]AOP35974.1 UDP-glucose 4-epimerase [Leptospira tipperaryensis]